MRTPITDALRLWLKEPGNAERFAREGNALASRLRALSEARGPGNPGATAVEIVTLAGLGPRTNAS